VRPDLAGEKTKIGGFAEKTLKKLNGARLCSPLVLMVAANAMGRGPMAPSKSWCKRCIGKSFGSMLCIENQS
jgi:hypothetical protein